MAYAAALGDALPCYMDTTRGVIAHPMFPVCFEWPVQVAMRALLEKTSLTRDEAMRGVHATHDTVIYRAIRPPERLTTQLTVAGVERRKPGAYLVTRLDTVDESRPAGLHELVRRHLSRRRSEGSRRARQAAHRCQSSR